jgi:hypothetical protein
LSCARSEPNATPVRPGNLRVGRAGGSAFKLQKPPQLRVPRPSRGRRAGTTTAYTTGGVERTGVAPAASPPTLEKTQGWSTLRGNGAMKRWATRHRHGDSGWLSGYSSISQLFRQRETLHAYHRSVCFLGFRVGEAKVGCTKNVSFQDQARVVVQRRVLLGGYQDALRTVWNWASAS